MKQKVITCVQQNRAIESLITHLYMLLITCNTALPMLLKIWIINCFNPYIMPNKLYTHMTACLNDNYEEFKGVISISSN